VDGVRGGGYFEVRNQIRTTTIFIWVLRSEAI
jgi:hypothetical protein